MLALQILALTELLVSVVIQAIVLRVIVYPATQETNVKTVSVMFSKSDCYSIRENQFV